MHFSILIPVHNESENITPLLFEIKEVMHALEKPWEVLVIDDNSTDSTWHTLESIKEKIPELTAIHLSKQSGQSTALEAGVQSSKGSIVITLDGDGQNDPHDIPFLLEKMNSFDLICGHRKNRQDTKRKKYISRIANYIRSWILKDGVHDTGCSLKIFKNRAIKSIHWFKGAHRFLPALLIIEGFTVTEAPVAHRARNHGTSNYSLINRGISTVTDLLGVWWIRRRRSIPEVDREIS